jgi:hypothetical protein
LLSLTQATGTVQLDLITKRGYHSIRDLQSRSNGNDADETTLPQDGAYTRYYANVTIGEPGQNIQLHVDTGSSDVWVIAKDAEVNPPAFEFPKGTPGGTCEYLNHVILLSLANHLQSTSTHLQPQVGHTLVV